MFIKNKNDLILFKNISSAFIYKGIALVISFFATPLYIKFIEDQEILGVWFTILSVLQWITILDLGIGNGLRNNIVRCLQVGDKKETKEYISSGYISLGVIVVLLIVLIIPLTLFCDWNSIFNVSTHIIPPSKIRAIVSATLVASLIALELKIAVSILYAIQKNAIANLTTLITNLLLFVFLLISSTGSASDVFDLQLLAIVYSLASLVPLVVVSVYLFKTTLKDSIPSWKAFNKEKAKTIVGSSLSFFVIQIGLIIIVSTNSWMVTKFCGAAFSVDYQIYVKLYSLIPMAFTLITQPMWSGFSAAKERGDIKWIINKYKTIIGIVALCLIGLIILTAVFPVIIDIWLGEHITSVEITSRLIFLFSTAMQLAMYAFTCFANGMNTLKCQAVCITIGALIKIPMALLLLSISPSWNMIVLSEGLSLLPIVIMQPIMNYKNIKYLKQSFEADGGANYVAI